MTTPNSNPIPSSSSNGPWNTTNLTSDESVLVEALWRTHHRDLIDIRPAAEARKHKVSGTSATFIARIHRFMVILIQRAQFEANGNDDNNSCLRDYLSFATHSTMESPLGRVVFPIHFPEFVTEFKACDLDGQVEPRDYFSKFSFDCFLFHKPEWAIPCVGCAMALAIVTCCQQQRRQQQQQPLPKETLDRFVDATQLVPRFLNINPAIKMMDIKTSLMGKLISVKGHIVKAWPKRLRLSSAEFGCSRCGTTIVHAFDAGRFSAPSSCPAEGCKGRSFQMNSKTCQYINSQELRLQEAQEESSVHAGRAPRQMVVEVSRDLVEACRPGDVVQIAATVETVNTALAAGKKGKRAKESATYELYMVGHSISTLSESNHNPRSKKKGKTRQKVFTQEQLQNITQICHADHRMLSLPDRSSFPFDLLVRSLCPSIIGHNEVKAGLLLCLLGGTQPTDRHNAIRYNSHMLIVGDPGMGKSQMLLASNQLAARAVYVGGNTSSTTGLTVTLTKEDRGGQSAIEAGALVLADQGICCIDEFDKMTKTDGLLEAMEQQQVSIAKAGVVASLPARCSIIAAANPKQGSYNMNKSVSENLNMPKPILSRFDLVFILRDRADSNLDQMVSSNIMNLYRETPAQPSNHQYAFPSTNAVFPNAAGEKKSETGIPLSDRLAWVTHMQKQPLPAELVRDYIAYAREFCKPKMTPEAADILKWYFLSLRNGQRQADTVPITTRQLEALVRLCQARAKACLRDLCTERDAHDVVDLMKHSVNQTHEDETGFVEWTRGGAGGKSKRKIKSVFEQELRALSARKGALVTREDCRCIALRIGMGLNWEEYLEELVEKSVLRRKRDGVIELCF